jgi:hypothetical protein
MFPYLRFQTSVQADYGPRKLGIFRAAGWLERTEAIEAPLRAWLRPPLNWFNENLRVPCLESNCRRAVFWFRTDAQVVIAKAWDVVAILRECGVAVDLQRTDAPGKIVYRDEHQIAAIPRRCRGRIRGAYFLEIAKRSVAPLGLILYGVVFSRGLHPGYYLPRLRGYVSSRDSAATSTQLSLLISPRR